MTNIVLHSRRSCPVCNSAQSRGRGNKGYFEIWACRRCGSWYTSALPDTESEQDYDDYYPDINLTTPEFISRRLDEIVATFDKFRNSNRLLDVGFGAGDLLRAAARAGWDAEGVEVSRPAVENAVRSGLNVHHGELAKMQFPDDYFDVVTAVEVLEHVPEPSQLCHEIARIVRPGGLFWATTPHSRGLSARLLGTHWSVVSPPEHLQLFSTRGAKLLLAEAGFRRIALATHAANPYEILHTLRSRRSPSISDSDRDEANAFSRNTSGFQLNERLSVNSRLLFLKRVINGALNVGRLGDSLKIHAVL